MAIGDLTMDGARHTSRGASSASACTACMKRSPSSLTRMALRRAALPSPAARDRARYQSRWDEIARIRHRRSPHRRARPCPGLRRAPPADWWSRHTARQARRWRTPRPAPGTAPAGTHCPAPLRGEQSGHPAIFHGQFNGMKTFQHCDRGRSERPRRQGARDFRPGPVAADMHDAGP